MTTFYDLPKPDPDALNRSMALTQIIQQEIAAQGGAISFSTFMQLALYHPEWGYYTSSQFELGKQGDFTTAPEISPLFAYCFANQFQQLFKQLGTIDILELGAGTGRFALDILKRLQELNAEPAHYYIFEISPALRQKQQQLLQTQLPDCSSRIIWLDQLPQNFRGMIIANEVLDALPVDCFRVEDNQAKERAVTWDNQQFAWLIRPPTSALMQEKIEKLRETQHLNDDYESELNLQLIPFIKNLADCLSEGLILLADYGYGQAEYYHPERHRGTLTCFYQHRKHSNPLFLPGLQDITAHVDFTEVIEIAAENGCELAGYTSQAAFLLACGLMDLAQAFEKNLSPADEFKLHQAIKILTMPMEMGERIKIMGLSKDIAFPLMGFAFQDRRRDL